MMRIRIVVDVGPVKLDCCVLNGLLVRYWYDSATCTLVARGIRVCLVYTAWRAFHSVHAHSRTGKDVRLDQVINSELMWYHRSKRTVNDTLAVV